MAQKEFDFGSQEAAALIFGSLDGNIDYLEKEFLVTLVGRGGAVTVTGDDAAVALAEKALVMAVVRMHTSVTPPPPKMALLGALREAYLQSLETASSSPAGA